MQRLYVLLPNPERCRLVINDLQAAGIIQQRLHVVASLAYRLDGLPQATVWQKTELARGIVWGLGLGGMAGLLGSLFAIVLPPAGLVLNGDAVLISSSLGAGVGGLMFAMLASHQHNRRLDRFRREIGSGRVLLLADVPRCQVESMRRLILQRHPEAQISAG